MEDVPVTIVGIEQNSLINGPTTACLHGGGGGGGGGGRGAAQI